VVLMLLGVVLAGVLAVALWPRGATPADEAQVRKDFEARTAASTRPDDAPAIPAPGIYRYVTTGSEELKLGVLPTETRPYPDSVSATLVDADTGCFTMTLNLLEQHGEDTTFCVDDGTIRLDRHEKRQQVGPLRPTAEMTCDPAVLVDPKNDSVPIDCKLALDGGPKQLNATLEGTSASNRSAAVTVDGTPVDATEVTIDFKVTGDLTGTWREQVWFSHTDALPLRITRDLHLDGLAAFTEKRDSTLAGLDPER
jgi:hypothetical protein